MVGLRIRLSGSGQWLEVFNSDVYDNWSIHNWLAMVAEFMPMAVLGTECLLPRKS